MARDAQMVGDRVNCEYYLQFADHYFRVLADNRARQEEQQARFRKPGDNDQDDEFVDDGDGFGDISDVGRSFDPRGGYGGYGNQRSEPAMARSDDEEASQPSVEQSERSQRGDDRGRDRDRDRDRSPRQQRPRREPAPTGASEPEMSSSDAARPPRPRREPAAVASEPEAPSFDAVRPRRPRREPAAAARSSEPDAPGFDAALLPPSIGRPLDSSAEENAEAPAPKRTRRARPSAQAAE